MEYMSAMFISAIIGGIFFFAMNMRAIHRRMNPLTLIPILIGVAMLLTVLVDDKGQVIFFMTEPASADVVIDGHAQIAETPAQHVVSPPVIEPLHAPTTNDSVYDTSMYDTGDLLK